MALIIRTNNQPRPLILGFELSDKEREEYKDLIDNIDERTFFRYKGNVYLLDDILTTTYAQDLKEKGWHGYTTDTYYSGVCIKLVDDDNDYVVVGTFFVEGN